MNRRRISSIDLLRGVVMILMALDHVRSYFHIHAMMDPTDLSQTDSALFLTRWITHFCAPVFFFLTGTSAFLAGQKLKSRKALSWWLFSRGIWLIFLELTVIKLAWAFSLHYDYIALVVIWALGWSMVFLSLLVYLPFSGILVTGLIIVAGHNLLDPVTAFSNPFLNTIWQILHVENTFQLWNRVFINTGYPLLPWLGVTALGYCCGKLYSRTYEKSRRIKILKWSGTVMIFLFVILRLFNLYGDPSLWSEQKNFLFTIFSFINTTKYPPSLLYLMMTLGPSMIFLAYAEHEPRWLARKVIVFGRVPFFFYILHLYVIHLAASLTAMAVGYRWSALVFNENWTPEGLKGYGFDLWIVYLVWFGVLALLFPACKWYDGYKSRHPDFRWLKYL